MPVYRGELKVIGSGSRKGTMNHRSVVEIGDHSLQYVKYDNIIQTYLEGALGREVAVIVSKRTIVAVKVGNKIYKDGEASWNIALGLFLILIGIPLLGLFLAGYLAIAPGIELLSNGLALSKNLPELEGMSLA